MTEWISVFIIHYVKSCHIIYFCFISYHFCERRSESPKRRRTFSVFIRDQCLLIWTEDCAKRRILCCISLIIVCWWRDTLIFHNLFLAQLSGLKSIGFWFRIDADYCSENFSMYMTVWSITLFTIHFRMDTPGVPYPAYIGVLQPFPVM